MSVYVCECTFLEAIALAQVSVRVCVDVCVSVCVWCVCTCAGALTHIQTHLGLLAAYENEKVAQHESTVAQMTSLGVEVRVCVCVCVVGGCRCVWVCSILLTHALICSLARFSHPLTH